MPDTEARLEGIYVIRTSVPATQMTAPTVVTTYKSLANTEREFLSLKAIDLDLRPVRHYTETRVRAHVFLCMLAAYLVWHLRQAWAPLTFTDELPARSFGGLLSHLATLTRNEIRYLAVEGTPTISQLALPTPTQRRAFELLNQPIPLTLT